MKIKLYLFTALLIVLNSFRTESQQDKHYNCFTILVGKNASVDGSVLMGHNEDNYGDTFTDWHKLPRMMHKQGGYQVFLSGDSIEEARQTNACLWISVSAFNAEQYLNEWGVAITTDASHSNVQNGKGRIVQCLRRIMAERAHSAREAVKIAGRLIETFGYNHSGRIYSVSDPDEAWVVEVVNGKQWAAARVPDDEVVLIPNYYVIDYIDLTDTINFLSSPDLIDYAVQQGWYDPDKGDPFNFREAYCNPYYLHSRNNVARRWAAINILSEKQYEINDVFPFSFRPKQKVSMQDIMYVLQNHYEGTEYESNNADSTIDPHKAMTSGICNQKNTFSTVVQLRNWLPVDIGCVMWIAPRYPCIQPYIPWYYGINIIPAGYENESYELALVNYLNKDRNFRELYPQAGYWIFRDFASQVDKNYAGQIEEVRKWKQRFESKIFKTVINREKRIARIYDSDPASARKKLTKITSSFAEKVLGETKRKLGQ